MYNPLKLFSGGGSDKSPEDITVIGSRVCEKEAKIIKHRKMKPSGNERCKHTEDEYLKARDILENELKILKDLYRNIITKELNNFPLNNPCTIGHISKYIGVKNEYILWKILINGILYNSGYNLSYSVISESEMAVMYQCDHLGGRYGYIDDYNSHHTIKLPNWRFVESVDSDIFYVERMY